MARYVALIRKEPDTDYWVDVPDMPGCVAQGSTRDEAVAHFEEAVKFYVRGLRADNVVLPPARTLQEVLASEEDAYVEAYVIEI